MNAINARVDSSSAINIGYIQNCKSTKRVLTYSKSTTANRYKQGKTEREFKRLTGTSIFCDRELILKLCQSGAKTNKKSSNYIIINKLVSKNKDVHETEKLNKFQYCIDEASILFALYDGK